jgi:LPXTG-motif cell wall-anchored protein
VRKKTKRLGALGATALAALVVIGPMSVVAHGQETTTTTASTTTTTTPQKTVHGQETDRNRCTSKVDLTSPGTPTPVQGGIGVTIATDAFPQPHRGDPITLSNTKITLAIPATLLQLGVDAGLINDGDVIPSVVTVVLKGVGTTQGTHTYRIDAATTISVIGGVARPIHATLDLPDTHWTPVNEDTDVFFREGSVKVVASIDLSSTIGVIAVATFLCSPSGSAEFIALGGTGAPVTTTTVATTTTTVAPTTTTVGGGTTLVTVQAPPADQLPRTGSNAAWLLALAVGLLSAGMFALKASRRAARSR